LALRRFDSTPEWRPGPDDGAAYPRAEDLQTHLENSRLVKLPRHSGLTLTQRQPITLMA
jgi:hypothetical protein